MSIAIKEPRELRNIYARRFDRLAGYRNRIWQVLVEEFFQRLVRDSDRVIDLGCGYGEFINHVRCAKKLGMDLNPESPQHLAPDVEFLHHDCSTPWPLPDGSLDVVFTSNFFEHLPDKLALKLTLLQAARCLRPGGRLIAMGPNIRLVGGAYWDFWDHFLCLTDRSLVEALEINGYRATKVIPRFLPYSMVGRVQLPVWLLRMYLRLPLVWPLFGKQFVVVATRV